MNPTNSPYKKDYEELSYYTLAHKDPSFVHQHIVDAFAVQTADNSTKPITIAFALIGLYLYVERNYSGKEIQRKHMELARKRKQWPTTRLPKKRGDITVSDVIKEPAGKKRDDAIRKWCESVWTACQDERQAVVDMLKELDVL